MPRPGMVVGGVKITDARAFSRSSADARGLGAPDGLRRRGVGEAAGRGGVGVWAEAVGAPPPSDGERGGEDGGETVPHRVYFVST